MKIAILLATYNSEKYLCEQLDSLFNQTYNKFDLYIHDDNSTDSTLNIINTYIKKYNNIFLLKDNYKNRKSMGSFMWLLENVDSDYYMFCDHDDVWLPNKIEKSISRMMKIEEKDKPALVCSDLTVVDENKNIISNSFWKYMKLRPDLLVLKKFAISCNLFTGCTMLINKKAKDVVLPLGTFAVMHDSWIGLNIISKCGKISCIEEQLILYRQHSNNVCGAQEVSYKVHYFVNKIINIKSVYNNYKNNYLMAKEIFPNISIFYFIFYRIIYLLKR